MVTWGMATDAEGNLGDAFAFRQRLTASVGAMQLIS
jgi:hypothetical protein